MAGSAGLRGISLGGISLGGISLRGISGSVAMALRVLGAGVCAVCLLSACVGAKPAPADHLAESGARESGDRESGDREPGESSVPEVGVTPDYGAGVESSTTTSVTVTLPTSHARRPASRTPAPHGALDGPALVDTEGAALRDEHAEVVRAVYRALVAGDLATLSEFYAGDDWPGQAKLLASRSVRQGVLDALRFSPANLGEGYLYPGFAAAPARSYSGYRTAFFLDYDPPEKAGGPLRWRGIAAGVPVEGQRESVGQTLARSAA